MECHGTTAVHDPPRTVVEVDAEELVRLYHLEALAVLTSRR